MDAGVHRAQVVLAACQSPLLCERRSASVLIPRLCSSILQAPSSCRHVRSPTILLCPPMDARSEAQMHAPTHLRPRCSELFVSALSSGVLCRR